MNFEDLLKKNQARANIPNGIHPWNLSQNLKEEPAVELDLDNQVRAQRAFFHLPKPRLFMWVVIGDAGGLDRFIDHYSRILPIDTCVILLADRNLPSAETVRNRFSMLWQTLFLQIPSFATESHFAIQLRYFSKLYPRRLGLGTWNLFVDTDELLPLPEELPTLQHFCQRLDGIHVTQLSCQMIDIWELQKEGRRDLYFDSFEDELQDYLNWNLSQMIWEGHETFPSENMPIGDFNYFILPNGYRMLYRIPLRKELLGFKATKPETGSKVVLTKPDENFSYSLSSHEPHSIYGHINDFMLRYPLLHFKFLRETYHFREKLYLEREEGKTWYAGDGFFQDLRKLNTEGSPIMGLGPYHILGEQDDTEVFAKFGHRFHKMADLVNEKYQIPAQSPYTLKEGSKSLYPLLHLDPLYVQSPRPSDLP